MSDTHILAPAWRNRGEAMVAIDAGNGTKLPTTIRDLLGTPVNLATLFDSALKEPELEKASPELRRMAQKVVYDLVLSDVCGVDPATVAKTAADCSTAASAR